MPDKEDKRIYTFSQETPYMAVTEAIMMLVSIVLLLRFIDRINGEYSYGGSNHG